MIQRYLDKRNQQQVHKLLLLALRYRPTCHFFVRCKTTSKVIPIELEIASALKQGTKKNIRIVVVKEV
jgi:hypothetical protein